VKLLESTNSNGSAKAMVHICFGSTASKAFDFTFSAEPKPHIIFHFDKLITRTLLDNRSLKRRRPLWDVDGGTSGGKKKRRLRLNLVTSRLSRPFSVPASNIINRGISKIAIWAKSLRSDQNELRKAAIMNRIRINLVAAKAVAHRELETGHEKKALGALMSTKARSHEVLPPSPLGLSNYDALDLEDEGFDDGNGGYDSNIYSDFNIMNPNTTVDETAYDFLDELDGIPPDLPEDRPPPPPDEKLEEILMEKERQRRVSFVRFIA